jgi:membrane protein implicated in regulation of membrane protease activity
MEIIQDWILWLIVAGALAIGEMLTEGFFLAWFGIGAAVACVAAFLGVDPVWQWVLFLVVSGILVANSRRFAERFTKAQPPGIGADRYIGKTGVVLEDVDNIKNTGQVRIGKEEWRADSGTDEVIPVGVRVKVTGLDGTHLVVEPVEEVSK